MAAISGPGRYRDILFVLAAIATAVCAFLAGIMISQAPAPADGGPGGMPVPPQLPDGGLSKEPDAGPDNGSISDLFNSSGAVEPPPVPF